MGIHNTLMLYDNYEDILALVQKVNHQFQLTCFPCKDYNYRSATVLHSFRFSFSSGFIYGFDFLTSAMMLINRNEELDVSVLNLRRRDIN